MGGAKVICGKFQSTCVRGWLINRIIHSADTGSLEPGCLMMSSVAFFLVSRMSLTRSMSAIAVQFFGSLELESPPLSE